MSDPHRDHRTSSTFIRYLGFQAPGVIVLGVALLAAVRSDLVEGVMAGGLLLLWIAKDLVLYPLVKRAYAPSGYDYPSRLVGRHGRAREDLAPRGYVEVAGELWRAQVARDHETIRAGATVVITGTVGSRLVVRLAQGAEVARST